MSWSSKRQLALSWLAGKRALSNQRLTLHSRILSPGAGFSRTSEPGTNLVELNKRVASVITWSHDNISNNEIFATAGCSMGTNATFGPVLWHGLDPIIDYQVLVGGPNIWDFNAQCGLRTYDSGFCDMDGVTTCSTDSDCSTVDENSQCVWSEMYPTIPVAFKSMPDHVHATNTCRVEPAAPGEVEPYAPFDESSMGYSAPEQLANHASNRPDCEYRWRARRAGVRFCGRHRGWRLILGVGCIPVRV